MATVLIVDDDKFTRNVLQTVLGQDERFADLGLVTHLADNGENGLAAFRAHRPDVVITDLLMPGMDGFALCNAIREEPGGDAVHLITMSGIYRDAAVAHRLRSEVDAQFFAKPYQLRELITYLSIVFGREGGGGQEQGPSPLAVSVSNGDLAQRQLPAVLFDFLEARASGHLTLRRGRISKVIELVVGHPLSVSSTARDEALGHFLVTFGVISDDEHKRAVRRAVEAKEKVSDALISLGIMTPEDMVARLTMQTCYKIMQSLRWPDGSWRFQPRDQSPAGPRGNPIDTVPLVFQGLRQSASFDNIPERVAAVENKPMALSPRGKALMPAVRQYLSARFAEAWVDGSSVITLLGAGLERSELYTALEVLLFCDAIAPVTVAKRSAAGDGDEFPSGDTGDFSVEELSKHSTARFARPAELSSGELYSMLFDDMSTQVPMSAGDLPIELPDEELTSEGYSPIELARMRQEGGAEPTVEELNYARRLLLKEYLRIQGIDNYAVLRVERSATATQIAEALALRKGKLALELFGHYDLGRDYSKLEEIHAAYDRAGEVLLDDDRRLLYDRTLDGEEAEKSGEPSLDAEIAFHAGEDLLQHGSYEGAIAQLHAAVAGAPDEADYHAALGWAIYLKGGRSPRAADTARPHLNQGLVINPDHPPSHEYKGLISADLGTDDAEAIFHLERALDADVNRAEALKALERVWMRRGELRPLERQYRRIIYRAAGSEPTLELTLWLKLAELYRSQLGEIDHARIAYESAARLAPEDPRIRLALGDLANAASDRFTARAELLRHAWRRDPLAAEPGIKLMQAALEAGRPDAAYMAASALVARGLATPEADQLYQRHRPRFLIRAQRRFDDELWEVLRHEDDVPELGALFELLAPAIEKSFPLELDDLDVDDAMEVSESELPETFVRVRSYVAQMLGVAVPRVFVRTDFGHQIHIGAMSPPLLLAGDDALTSPERSELSFRLGRAMTYLIPGRAFAGSRPGRLLKAAVLAVFATISPGAPMADPEGYVALIKSNLDQVSPDALVPAQQLVAELTRAANSLDLSRWAHALGRTADRVGFVLCGDLPAAVRFVRDSGSADAIDDLVDYALSSACWHIRAQIGLSIDV